MLILTGLGLNCEAETEAGFPHGRRHARARPPARPARRTAPDRGWRTTTILAFVGGFAFGDHLGAGFVFANKIRWRLYDQLLRVHRARAAWPWASATASRPWCGWACCPASTATTARRGRRWPPTTAWATATPGCAWPSTPTRRASGRAACDAMDLPARHGEGKFLAESPELLERLEAERPGRRPLRRPGRAGRPSEWPHNPNGSPRRRGRDLRSVGPAVRSDAAPGRLPVPVPPPAVATQRRSGTLPDEGEGLAIFRNGVDAAAASA